MTTATRVLPAPTVAGGPRFLEAAPADQLDPVVRRLVDRAREEGRREGRAEGRREGRDEALEQADRLAGQIRAATAELVEQARAATDEVVDGTIAFGIAVARAVLAREPHDGGAAVAAAARAALDAVDDPAPVLAVHPDDLGLVEAAVADLPAVVVRPDPSLAPGEACLRGTWARVDLTHAAQIDEITRQLHGDL